MCYEYTRSVDIISYLTMNKKPYRTVSYDRDSSTFIVQSREVKLLLLLYLH